MTQARGLRAWVVLTAIEAGTASLLLTSLAVGPFPSKDLRPILWLALSVALFALYFVMVLVVTRPVLSAPIPETRRLWLSSAPFAAIFAAAFAAVELRPELAAGVWTITSSIQPFPYLAEGTGVMGVFLLKAALAGRSTSLSDAGRQARAAVAGFAVAVAMLLLGAFQATMFIQPLGNATLRFWAIADGIFAGRGYPVTLTEPGPVSAGSPPYVYDLPLFPLLIRGAFGVLGHNSAAVHLPGIISSTLFPFALYLLIHRATRSRVTAVLFTALASLFPFLRFWVLNLPDPDPFFLTSLCFAAYFYLRALDARESTTLWIAAGLTSGAASLARPEGVLYVGCLGLGILASRPRLRELAIYCAAVGLFIFPTVIMWMANFGFLWPQNYNGTLGLTHPAATYQLLERMGELPRYYEGLGLSPQWAAAFALLFLFSTIVGILIMALKDRPLLAIAIPALGNTVAIFFTNPWISNAFQYADFFRHASFGIPFMVLSSAYGFQFVVDHLKARGRTRVVPLVGLLLILLVVAREGDIDANPTLTHRYGSPIATQVLTSDPHLSLQAILQHPMALPTMSYHRDKNNALVAYPSTLKWPDAAIAFFRPFDVSFDSRGTDFGYGSLVAFLLALGFGALADGCQTRMALS